MARLIWRRRSWSIAAAVILATVPCTVARAQSDLEVSGEVSGLYPGIATTVQATVHNPQGFTVDITAMSVRARDSTADCPGSLLTFGELDATVAIPPGSSATIPVSVQMDRSAPDACQGVEWPLEFRAFARSDDGVVTTPPPDGFPDLPSTGFDIAASAWVGLVVLAVGLVLATRRRVARAGRVREERPS